MSHLVACSGMQSPFGRSNGMQRHAAPFDGILPSCIVVACSGMPSCFSLLRLVHTRTRADRPQPELEEGGSSF
eukprot:8799093-Alexandrium_andersonii.AAC.1